jgi:hypothetical protein
VKEGSNGRLNLFVSYGYMKWEIGHKERKKCTPIMPSKFFWKLSSLSRLLPDFYPAPGQNIVALFDFLPSMFLVGLSRQRWTIVELEQERH